MYTVKGHVGLYVFPNIWHWKNGNLTWIYIFSEINQTLEENMDHESLELRTLGYTEHKLQELEKI